MGRNPGNGLELLFSWPLKHCGLAVSVDHLSGTQDVPLKASVEKVQNKALT